VLVGSRDEGETAKKRDGNHDKLDAQPAQSAFLVAGYDLHPLSEELSCQAVRVRACPSTPLNPPLPMAILDSSNEMLCLFRRPSLS
jgi:hypothetical protein